MEAIQFNFVFAVFKAVADLQQLSGKKLTGKDGYTIIITNVDLSTQKLGKKIQEDVSMTPIPPTVSEPHNVCAV